VDLGNRKHKKLGAKKWVLIGYLTGYSARILEVIPPRTEDKWQHVRSQRKAQARRAQSARYQRRSLQRNLLREKLQNVK
jgi:hypothetical protein